MLRDIIRFIMSKFQKLKTPSIEAPKIEETDKLTVQAVEKQIDAVRTDPQTLFNNLLTTNNLKIDFDVLEGSIPTQYGIIKLEKPTLVIKATYVS